MPPETLVVLEQLAAIFDREGVPFVAGDSVASGAWGEPRSTHDVDLFFPVMEELACAEAWGAA